jgi:molybdopterin-guanine dinucleotide biosynthesis adapter protein
MAFQLYELGRRTLRHSSHSHELEKPDKDSQVHQTAGANPAAMVTASMATFYLPASGQTRPNVIIQTYFNNIDVILIEGWISGFFFEWILWYLWLRPSY